MNKGVFALLMLVVLLLPMYAGLRRIRNLPRRGSEIPANSEETSSLPPARPDRETD